MPVPVIISDSDLSIIDQAIAEELKVQQLYRHLSNQMKRVGFFGASKHFKSASDEEGEHYQKLADFLNDRGSFATLPEITSFGDEVGSLRLAIETAYQAEYQLGLKYSNWYNQTTDPILKEFFLFFLGEQRSATGEYGDLIARLDIARDNPAALLMIDEKLGS